VKKARLEQELAKLQKKRDKALRRAEEEFLAEYNAEQARSDAFDYQRHNGIPQPRRVSIR
jgi:hypothetical protein